MVAFSDNGCTVQVPEDDQAAILAAIKRLASQRGTSLANGIYAALKTLEARAGSTRYYTNLTPAVTPSPMPVLKGTYSSGVIILTLDVSRSMCSTDIKPNRIQAAETAALSFIDSKGADPYRHRGLLRLRRIDSAANDRIAGTQDGH